MILPTAELILMLMASKEDSRADGSEYQENCALTYHFTCESG